MNQKEKREIGINMTILVETIIDKNSQSEDVANAAISFVADTLKRFPEIKGVVELMFEDDFDKYIAWINWEEQFL